MARNQVVTRDQFEAFLANSEDFEILQSVPQSQRQLLFDIGTSVCQIVRPDGLWGSGFHLGGGWIMTALNVISKKETLGAEYVSEVSFHFPTKPAIVAASRSCIFSNFRGAVAKNPCKDVVKDLAVIYVPELDLQKPEYNTITGLGNPCQKPPKIGDRVYLVHFGKIHGLHADQTPQQFSVNGSVLLEHVVSLKPPDPSENRFSTHNTYWRHGSSGAPLLMFNDNEDIMKFRVAGVHFAGDERDGTGVALWFTEENWLRETLIAASAILENRITSNVSKVLQSQVNTNCQVLQKNLRERRLRVIINIPRPEFVTGLFEDIIFRP